jgi:hypothetical protein
MRTKLKYFIPLIVFFAFFWFIPAVSAVYICPGDNSQWPERGDCDAYCVQGPCIEEHQNQHKVCRSGACVIVEGPGVDLCQSDTACRQRVCRDGRCVITNAPGPGAAGPDMCRTELDCQRPRYRCDGASCVRDDDNGTYTTSNCDNRCAVQPRQPAGDTPSRQPAGGDGVSIPNPIGAGTFQELVERIARYLFQIGIPIAVIMILYAAFLYMTAAGSEEKVSKAHKALTYAAVGLAILFLAWGITSLVKELLSGETTTSPGAEQQDWPSEQRFQQQYQQQQQQQPQQGTNPDSWQWQQ